MKSSHVRMCGNGEESENVIGWVQVNFNECISYKDKENFLGMINEGMLATCLVSFSRHTEKFWSVTN